MPNDTVSRIVVAGDAPTAALAGAALALSLRNSGVRVTIITTPGSGDPVVAFTGGGSSLQAALGIDGKLLTDIASVGLGTRYRGFGDAASNVFVPLGGHGKTLRLVDFHHYVAKLRAAGEGVEYNDYSLPAACAEAGRLVMPSDERDAVRRTIGYDLYANSALFTERMLGVANQAGARHIESGELAAQLDASGLVTAVNIDSGESIEADFFVDCSSQRAISAAAQTDSQFDDWSEWLPHGTVTWSAAQPDEDPGPYMCADRTERGWRLTLSTRDGTFAADVSRGGAPNGNFRDHWVRNCVAIGTAATRLEPMEVTPLHFADAGVRQLLAMMPRHPDNPALAAEFNRVMQIRAEDARDYQSLRYALTDADYAPPVSLQRRLQLFRARGRYTKTSDGLLGKARWISSLINFGAWPDAYDPLADMIDEQRLRDDLARFRADIVHVTSRPDRVTH